MREEPLLLICLKQERMRRPLGDCLVLTAVSRDSGCSIPPESQWITSGISAFSILNTDTTKNTIKKLQYHIHLQQREKEVVM